MIMRPTPKNPYGYTSTYAQASTTQQLAAASSLRVGKRNCTASSGDPPAVHRFCRTILSADDDWRQHRQINDDRRRLLVRLFAEKLLR
jgi:hypothetical protein